MNFYPQPEKFEQFEHTADVGIHARGKTRDELYANAAFAMIDVMFETHEFESSKQTKIILEEAYEPDLLVNWLSEINYLLLMKDFLLVSINWLQIKKANNRYILNAELSGADRKRYNDRLTTEIKAVTFHKLIVEKREHEYFCQVIFDI